jgi:hypothetical protein
LIPEVRVMIKTTNTNLSHGEFISKNKDSCSQPRRFYEEEIMEQTTADKYKNGSGMEELKDYGSGDGSGSGDG